MQVVVGIFRGHHICGRLHGVPKLQPDCRLRVVKLGSHPRDLARGAALILSGGIVWTRRRSRAVRGSILRQQLHRRAQAGDSDEVGSDDDASASPEETTPGGLAVWRLGQDGPEMRLPVILFPASDLLLLGHTKRMHLYEPRWVDMVTTARRDFAGIVGLVYFDDDGDIVRTITVAEIVACENLGVAGRMVTVRGVARAQLRGLSQEVVTPDEWGLALVEELPELRAADCSGAAAAAALELEALIGEIDLSAPRMRPPTRAELEEAEMAEAEAAMGVIDDESDASPNKNAQLWTHERVSAEEGFAEALASTDAWRQRLSTAEGRLADVAVCLGEGGLLTAEARGALAVFYAVLSGASLRTRLEFFASAEQSLAERLRSVADLLREREGMARARRALASVFSEDPSAGIGETPEGTPP